MLKKQVKTVDDFIAVHAPGSLIWDDWCRIKKEFEELAQQTHNSKSIPLLCECGCHIPEGDFHCHVDGKTYCEVCAK